MTIAQYSPQSANNMNRQNQKSVKSIDIAFHNITYGVQIPETTEGINLPCNRKYKQKQILKNISGIFKAGKCSAIMGASGAGKTTLLNILACRVDHKSEGKLYANNVQYNYQMFGDFANYVMQHDVLMETLTVRQTLQFAANLKLNLSKEQKKKVILKLSKQLKLQKCMDTLVGGPTLKGISGGQRKRTSIAFQLISDPQVLFLDQPTSGLDSLTSFIIVSNLQKLAHQRNKTVIMTIHQPNSETYQLFDNLMLLVQGKIIYQGKAQITKNYFQSNFNLPCPQFCNPPDYFMSKIHHEDQQNRKRYPKYFDTYENKTQQNIVSQIQNRQKSQLSVRTLDVGIMTVLGALIHRNFLNTTRNPMLLKSKVLQTMFLSLFVGGIYFDIRSNGPYTQQQVWNTLTGFFFFQTIAAMMTSLSPVTITFPAQRTVFLKQQDSKLYNVSQYFLARNIIQIPELIIVPLISALILYWMVGLANTGGQFFTFYFSLFLMGFAGSSMGLLLGSVILDAKSVSSVVPMLILPFILFSGFFKNRDDLPRWLFWIEYISPNKYGFIGLVKNQVIGIKSLVANLKFDIDLWPALFILIGIGLAFRLLSLFFLWYLKKRIQ